MRSLDAGPEEEASLLPVVVLGTAGGGGGADARAAWAQSSGGACAGAGAGAWAGAAGAGEGRSDAVAAGRDDPSGITGGTGGEGGETALEAGAGGASSPQNPRFDDVAPGEPEAAEAPARGAATLGAPAGSAGARPWPGG